MSGAPGQQQIEAGQKPVAGEYGGVNISTQLTEFGSGQRGHR
jgi:hypothetical protein